MKCPHCQADQAPGDRFCADCGQPVAGAGAPAVTLVDINRKLRSGAAAAAKGLVEAYLKRDPRSDAAWVTLGDAEEDLHNPDEAAAAYRKALELNPRSYWAYIGLGILARKRADRDAAMEYYRRAVEIDPNLASAYTSMVVIKLEIGANEEALELAEKAWRLDRADATVAANLAVAYHYVGRLADRDRLVEEARRLGYGKLDRLQQIFSGELTVRK